MYTIVQKNVTASGALTPPSTPLTYITGVGVDTAGTVIIKDGTGTERLHMLFAAGQLLMFPSGSGILCQNGATIALTGVSNCSIFFGA